MDKKEIDLRGKNAKEILKEYSEISQTVQKCGEKYEEEAALKDAINVYAKVRVQKNNIIDEGKYR